MKRVLSVGEFKRYLEKTNVRHITFASIHQPWYSRGETLELRLRFHRIGVADALTTVYLVGEDGQSVMFDRVFMVELSYQKRLFVTECVLHCKNPNGGAEEVYKLLLS